MARPLPTPRGLVPGRGAGRSVPGGAAVVLTADACRVPGCRLPLHHPAASWPDVIALRLPPSPTLQTATPESQGLSTAGLDRAEEQTNNEVGERDCFLVVKNGKIVKERYRRGRTAATISELASHTKSLCSSVGYVASA